MSCSIEGCHNIGKLSKEGKRFYPRGYCNTHYKKFCKENREIIEQDKIKPSKCSVENCDRPKPYKKGLCEIHYKRLKKNGDVNIVQKRREGQTSHPLYNTYHGMKKRCLSKNDKDYKNYGGRGITICERWLGVDGFFNFTEDMGERPEGFTLDRKDYNGNYSPENCRWTDINTQAVNKRGSTGAAYYKNLGKYRARIAVNGVGYALGLYDKLEDAIEARKKAEIELLGKEIER